jgi:hypothetical protein
MKLAVFRFFSSKQSVLYAHHTILFSQTDAHDSGPLPVGNLMTSAEEAAEELARALEEGQEDISEQLQPLRTHAKSERLQERVRGPTISRIAGLSLYDESVGTALAYLVGASPAAASEQHTIRALATSAGESALLLQRRPLQPTRREQAIGQLFIAEHSKRLLPLHAQQSLVSELVQAVSDAYSNRQRAGIFLLLCNILLGKACKLHGDVLLTVIREMDQLALHKLNLHALPFWAVNNAAAALVQLAESLNESADWFGDTFVRLALSNCPQIREISCTAIQCVSNPIDSGRALAQAVDALDASSALRYRDVHSMRLAAAAVNAIDACSESLEEVHPQIRADTAVLLLRSGLPFDELASSMTSSLHSLVEDARCTIRDLTTPDNDVLTKLHMGVLAASTAMWSSDGRSIAGVSTGEAAALAGRAASQCLCLINAEGNQNVDHIDLRVLFMVSANIFNVCLLTKQSATLFFFKTSWSQDCLELLAQCAHEMPPKPLKEASRIAREESQHSFLNTVGCCRHRCFDIKFTVSEFAGAGYGTRRGICSRPALCSSKQRCNGGAETLRLVCHSFSEPTCYRCCKVATPRRLRHCDP